MLRSRPIRSATFTATGAGIVVRCFLRRRRRASPMAVRLGAHGPYPPRDLVVGGPRGRGLAPVVEAGPGDPDDGAQPHDAVAALAVGDKPAAGHQRVAPVKHQRALRRLSRSSSSSRIPLRAAARPGLRGPPHAPYRIRRPALAHSRSHAFFG
jgi:hypothetical protein